MKAIKRIFLVCCMIFIVLLVQVAAMIEAEAENKADQHATNQLPEALILERQNRGIVGFEGEYALSSDDEPVSIIVLFESDPAGVQVVEALEYGRTLSESLAESIAEDDHTLFRQELDRLFDSRGRAVRSSYEIHWEYRRALNGLSITLPSNMVENVANFESVRVVYPNIIATSDNPNQNEIINTPESIEVVNMFTTSFTRNPPGMRPGREDMWADQMHALGYRGEGVVVAVLDSGIDYNHSAFDGCF